MYIGITQNFHSHRGTRSIGAFYCAQELVCLWFRSVILISSPLPCSSTDSVFPYLLHHSDDFHLRVFNYNTSERVAGFEAHPDYIRFALHLVTN